jgi:hypothetical protein
MTTIESGAAALCRPDKWCLSAGDGILWAPAFPVWLDHPGFWDEAHIYYHPFAPLFSVALLGADGREAPLKQISRAWRPDQLTCEYQTPAGARLTEVKTAEGRGRFRSAWSIAGDGSSERDLAGARLVAFTAQPGESTTDARAVEAGISWRRALIDRREVAMPVTAALTCDRHASAASVRSEGSAVQPHWRFTPFGERWTDAGLRPEVRLEGVTDHGLVYAAVASEPLGGGGGRGSEGGAAFEIMIEPDDTAYRLPPTARSGRDSWSEFLAGYPRFECSDERLTRYYDYRLFGLHLCRLEGGAGNVRHPAIAEGISYFHVPITYSGQCHMMECRWSQNPDVARGTLLNFLDNQKENGSFHGRIYTNHLIGTDFYHANWGDALLAVDALHTGDGYLRQVYERLGKYVRWLDTSRDPESSGMYTVINHFETGQEYMSRYQAVNPRADEDGWKDATRLKAIDATVYGYQLKRALAAVARRLGDEAPAAEWDEGATRVGRAIMEQMWDDQAGFFSDINPATGERTGVRAAVCFYPLLTDLLDDTHVERLLAILTDPREFWTPWPLPSSAVSDPLFNAEAEWKGKRHVCPWNGRVWPMTCSHVIDGLIRQWRRRPLGTPTVPGGSSVDDSPRHRCGAVAAEMLTKFIHMMFHDRDLARPNCFEHYNPLTGHACEYRGIDDYQHSWVIDLLIRGFAGVDADRWGDPAGSGLAARRGGSRAAVTIDPLPPGPHTPATIHLDNLHIRGRTFAISITPEIITATGADRQWSGRRHQPLSIDET